MLGSFLRKLQALDQQIYLKKTPAQMFPYEFCDIFLEHLFYRTPPGDCFCILR